MADKTETFVRARRRKDDVIMVLGRRIIEAYPHKFEELEAKPAVEVDIQIEKVGEDIEIVFDVDDDIPIPTEEAMTFAQPETIEEYRKQLTKMNIPFKPQHGIPGLKKLYDNGK